MRIAAVACLTSLVIIGGCSTDVSPKTASSAVSQNVATVTPLVTGRAIAPTTMASQDVGSLPMNLITSADEVYAISTDAGFRQFLWATRISDGVGVSHISFPNRGTGGSRGNGLYYGLAAAPGVIYAAQGAHDSIAVVNIDSDGQLKLGKTIRTKKGDFPAGLALDAAGRLYVANNDPQALPPVIKPSSVSIYDPAAGTELGRYAFSDSFGGTPNFPYAIAVTSDGKRLFVGSERDGIVYVLDTSDPAHITEVAEISTGTEPSALLLDKAQKRLFVANAGSDTISIVDTATNAIIDTYLLRPDVAKSLAGATPTGLALSPDEKFLYVSLGDMNAVAVIDVADKELEGYIPAGWYPSAVVVSTDGQKLLVANAKGTTIRNPNPPAGKRQMSPLNILEGNVVSIAIPKHDELKKQTELVLENNRLTAKFIDRPNPLKDIGLQAGKITHVIYIVKENRTYDQVLGDLKQGNGNPAYNIFGRDITPNQHAIAERFGLMDNFYDCGEVSGDGWVWSTQAMANPYVIRNVPYNYSSRGRAYDFEGTDNEWPTAGFPSTGPDGKPLSQFPAFKEGMKPMPDVGESAGGHIWDMAEKHGITFRNYGFFVNNGVKQHGTEITPDNYPSSTGVQPGGRDLGGITDIDFRRFDLNYPDSEAWNIYFDQTKKNHFKWTTAHYGSHQAISRFTEWNTEFQQMLAKDPTGASVPNLMTVRFCTDHTSGANPNAKTPRAMVADNDYAVGQLVETISKSPIWEHTAIFVIEDDAQNGPDHVDAHRSTCFAISPWLKRGAVDHDFHNTASCLRTIELLLGLPPMCQYDAIAAPVGVWDTAPNNTDTYAAILPAPEIIGDTNPDIGEFQRVSPESRLMMEESMKMDFTIADRAPADKLNEIIWKMSRGYNSTMPPTPNGISGVKLISGKDQDDD